MWGQRPRVFCKTFNEILFLLLFFWVDWLRLAEGFAVAATDFRSVAVGQILYYSCCHICVLRLMPRLGGSYRSMNIWKRSASEQ